MINNAINIYYPNSDTYGMLQNMVSKRYQEIYAAKINPSPDLFVFLNKSINRNEVKSGACFGVNYASNKRLFSEIYLDNAIDVLLYKQFHRYIDRLKIAEISSVTSFNYPGAGKELAALINHILFLLGIDCALITVTEKLEGILQKVNAHFIPLTMAARDKLPIEARDSWGSYYTTKPKTGLILVRDNIAKFAIRSIENDYRLEESNFHIVKHNLLNIDNMSRSRV